MTNQQNTDLGVSHWNYRVMSRTVPTGGDDFEEQFTVIEAYYDEAGKVVAWCDAAPMGEGHVSSLVADLERMVEATAKPVLPHDELPHTHSDGGDRG